MAAVAGGAASGGAGARWLPRRPGRGPETARRVATWASGPTDRRAVVGHVGDSLRSSAAGLIPLPRCGTHALPRRTDRSGDWPQRGDTGVESVHTPCPRHGLQGHVPSRAHRGPSAASPVTHRPLAPVGPPFVRRMPSDVQVGRSTMRPVGTGVQWTSRVTPRTRLAATLLAITVLIPSTAAPPPPPPRTATSSCRARLSWRRPVTGIPWANMQGRRRRQPRDTEPVQPGFQAPPAHPRSRARLRADR